VLACHNVTNSATIHKTAISVAFVLEFGIRHRQERRDFKTAELTEPGLPRGP